MTTNTTPNLPNLPTGATLKQRTDGNYNLRCTWEKTLPDALKRLGGKWKDDAKAWIIPAEALDKLDALFARRAAKANAPEAVAAREAAALETDRKAAVKWIGYVEEAAREGRVYDNGVAKLRGELKISRWPELVERLNAAIAAAREKRRQMEAGWAAEKAARETAQQAHHAEVEAHRHLYPISELPEMNRPCRHYSAVVVYTSTGKSWYMSGEDGDGIAPPNCWDTRVCYAYFREATADEISTLEAEEAAAKVEREARAERETNIRKAREMIIALNNRPEHPEVVGREISNTRNIYGGGERVVVGAEHIWLIEGNGTDGGDWSLNNLPGEIAWCAPYSHELEALVRGFTFLGEFDVSSKGN